MHETSNSQPDVHAAVRSDALSWLKLLPKVPFKMFQSQFSFVHCGEVYHTLSLYRRVLCERFHRSGYMYTYGSPWKVNYVHIHKLVAVTGKLCCVLNPVLLNWMHGVQNYKDNKLILQSTVDFSLVND